MTMYYTPRDERIVEETVRERVVTENIGRKPESAEERDRIWELLKLSARGSAGRLWTAAHHDS